MPQTSISLVLQSMILLCLIGNSSAAQSSNALVEVDFHSTPQLLFAEFSKRYNSDQELLLLITPKTKAEMLFSGVYSLAIAPQEQRREFTDWEKSWASSVAAIIEDAGLDWKADNSPVVFPLSKWDKLDRCLQELMDTSDKDKSKARNGSPQYGSTILNLELNDSRAKGSIRLLVNGGIADGLNRGSPKWLDIDPIPIHFIKIDKKWFVCNETEYFGKYIPR